MAAITVTTSTSGNLKRFYGTGTANQSDTLTTTAVADHRRQRLISASIVYSAAPTQTGVTITIDSGVAAAHDVVLHSGTANIRYTYFVPDEDIWLLPGDAVLVSAPAAGGVITASILVVTEEL